MAIGRIMCFGSSSKGETEDVEARKNKEIDRQLKEDQRRLAKEVKLLLLGAQRNVHHKPLEGLLTMT